MTSQFRVRQPLADSLRNRNVEALRIGQRPLVVAESLFVNVSEQVERFDGHIGSMDTSLQERPEILHAVCVDLSVDVSLGVVDEPVVKLIQSFIRQERIGVYARSSLNVLADQLLKFWLAACLNRPCSEPLRHVPGQPQQSLSRQDRDRGSFRLSCVCA